MHARTLIFVLSAGLIISLTGCGDHTGEFKYVAIGASDAVGVGASPITHGYVYQIQDGLKADGRDIGLLDLGIPGLETKDIRDAETRPAIDEKPELITIFVGPNGIVGGVKPEVFHSALSGMLSDLQEKTDAFIAIATIPDLTSLPRFREHPDFHVTRERINSFNDIIRILHQLII